MDLAGKIEKELVSKYGEFETDLEKSYKELFIYNLINGKSKDRLFWTTYNQVILEIRNNTSDDIKLKEILYHLTDDNIDYELCISLVEGIKNKTKELNRLYEKLKNL